MSKNIRKLMADLDRSFKQVDEGIAMLSTLEVRLEHAQSVQMKEKYESDIKREIKKLQRHRDTFKQHIKDSEIKDKTKMIEARRKIEDQMEKFRELEKEYKQKKLTKVVYQNANELESKYNFSSSSENDSDNSSSGRGSDSDSLPPSDDEENSPASDRSSEAPSDKEWLNLFLNDSLRKMISDIEAEISKLRQNKQKTVAKKNKERITSLDQRVQYITSLLTKVGEVQPLLELLDGKSLRRFRQLAAAFTRSTLELEQGYAAFAQELDSIIELNQQNLLPLSQAPKEESKSDAVKEEKDERSQLQKDIQAHPEVMSSEAFNIEDLRVGNICDAQDYLGVWRVCICTDEISPTSRMLHFLNLKANRDEQFKQDEDNARVGPVFSKTQVPVDKNVRQIFQQLKTYMESYRQKTGKTKVDFGSSANAPKKQTTPQQSGRTTPQPEKAEKGAKKQKVGKGSALPTQTLQVQPQTPQSFAQNTPQQQLPVNNNKVGLSEDQSAAQKMATAQPQMKSKQVTSSNLPAGGKDTPQQPLFAGNPFQLSNTFKTLNKPVGLSIDDPPVSHLGTPQLGGLPAANLKNLEPSFGGDSKPFEFPGLGHQKLGQLPSPQDGAKNENLKAERFQKTMDLLDASFASKPDLWDQEVQDPKQPVGVFLKNKYPTVPMYTHAANFSKFDLDTLFFTFYYQQETQLQYYAAVELKKEKWLFNKRFETWFKKVENQLPGNFPNASAEASSVFASQMSGNSSSSPYQRRREFAKYQFFDFERWQIKSRGEDIEMDLNQKNQIENELIVQLPDQQPSQAQLQGSGRGGSVLMNSSYMQGYGPAGGNFPGAGQGQLSMQAPPARHSATGQQQQQQ